MQLWFVFDTHPSETIWLQWIIWVMTFTCILMYSYSAWGHKSARTMYCASLKQICLIPPCNIFQSMGIILLKYRSNCWALHFVQGAVYSTLRILSHQNMPQMQSLFSWDMHDPDWLHATCTCLQLQVGAVCLSLRSIVNRWEWQVISSSSMFSTFCQFTPHTKSHPGFQKVDLRRFIQSWEKRNQAEKNSHFWSSLEEWSLLTLRVITQWKMHAIHQLIPFTGAFIGCNF